MHLPNWIVSLLGKAAAMAKRQQKARGRKAYGASLATLARANQQRQEARGETLGTEAGPPFECSTSPDPVTTLVGPGILTEEQADRFIANLARAQPSLTRLQSSFDRMSASALTAAVSLQRLGRNEMHLCEYDVWDAIPELARRYPEQRSPLPYGHEPSTEERTQTVMYLADFLGDRLRALLPREATDSSYRLVLNWQQLDGWFADTLGSLLSCVREEYREYVRRTVRPHLEQIRGLLLMRYSGGSSQEDTSQITFESLLLSMESAGLPMHSLLRLHEENVVPDYGSSLLFRDCALWHLSVAPASFFWWMARSQRTENEVRLIHPSSWAAIADWAASSPRIPVWHGFNRDGEYHRGGTTTGRMSSWGIYGSQVNIREEARSRSDQEDALAYMIQQQMPRAWPAPQALEPTPVPPKVEAPPRAPLRQLRTVFGREVLISVKSGAVAVHVKKESSDE